MRVGRRAVDRLPAWLGRRQIVVIGAGAAGLTAASELGRRSRRGDDPGSGGGSDRFPLPSSGTQQRLVPIRPWLGARHSRLVARSEAFAAADHRGSAGRSPRERRNEIATNCVRRPKTWRQRLAISRKINSLEGVHCVRDTGALKSPPPASGLGSCTSRFEPTIRQVSEFRRTIGGNIADLGRVGKSGSALPLPTPDGAEQSPVRRSVE
jgi:hypothetical protein